MKKITILLIIILGSIAVKAQNLPGYGASLAEVNTYLGELYSSAEYAYNDTIIIDYRKEALLLQQSGNKEMEVNGFITLGLLDFYGNREEAAIRSFQKALARDSACYLCYDKLHWLYWYGKNNYGEANHYLKISTAKFETLVAQDSGNIVTWARLFNLYALKEGTVPLKMQQRMRYIADKMVSLAPDNAYYWWQRSFQYENNPEEKERTLLKAYALRPGYVLYWDALANFYCDHKQEDKMRKILEDARSYEEPNLLYWYQQKATYLYRSGKKTEAAQVFKEAKSKGFDIVYK